MKNRLWFILALVMLALCLAGTAGADKSINPKFWPYMKAGETYLPDYPDWGYLIGEGLTKEDFDITYSSRSRYLEIDEDGTLTVSSSATRRFYLTFDVIYTPKVEGVGEKTSFVCSVIDADWLTYIKPIDQRKILALDQPAVMQLRTNSGGFPEKLVASGYDERIISVSLKSNSSDLWFYDITPLAVGETTVTVTGYNGVSCTFDVVVMEPPTELTFAQDVYYCYVGETISLGMKLGEGEHAPIFEKASVTMRFAMTDQAGGTQYSAGEYFPDGMLGDFVSKRVGKHIVEAKTYNGFSDSAVVYVYIRSHAVSAKMSSDVIRVGETGHMVVATDTDGNKFTPRFVSITKGSDIASLEGAILTTTDTGEVEVTVTNEDGSTVSCTFVVEPYPDEIILNAEAVTLQIGETFEIEVGFDKGWLEYELYAGKHSENVQYSLYPTRIENGVVTAQAPGTTTYVCQARELVKTITITVPDGDKALTVHAPENPVGVGDTFQITVKDKTGKVYPATYAMGYLEDEGEITSDGIFTALAASMATDVSIDLEDGRHLTYEVVIVQKPRWLQHAGIIARLGGSPYVNAQSDVGEIPWQDLEVTVEDESIATYKNGKFTPLKKGNTKVTIKSIYTGVTTDFTLEVRPENDDVVIGSRSFQLPCGFTAKLPAVYDASGNEKTVKWVITHDNPGTGNPDKSGFTLDGDEITCTWPDASCEVTGYMDGASKWVRVSVFGCKMAETIYIDPEVITLKIGEYQNVKVLTDEPGALLLNVYWVFDTEDIVTVSERDNGAYYRITGHKPGRTLGMAYLDNGAYALCMVTVYDPYAEPDNPTDRIPGDADKDGVVTILDALMVLQYSVGWNVNMSMSNADVDADGVATILDALRILQYCVGWDVELL